MRVKRRDLLRSSLLLGAMRPWRTLTAAAGASAPRTSTAPRWRAGRSRSAEQPPTGADAPPDADFIVIGSGAGGGTVAARLAEEGFTVLVLEAGGDPRATSADDYDVPAFHPRATENDAMKWSFFVRHYKDDAQQRRDPKYRATEQGEPVDGVLYPRAAALGGCTAHNAMILVYPHDADWNQLADITGDRSWRAERMRTYFERLEDCRHRPLEKWLSKLGLNRSRHGWRGWLTTEHAVPEAVFGTRDLRRTLLASIRRGLHEFGPPDAVRVEGEADPNDARIVADNAVGLRYLPVTTRNHQRNGSRERLLDVASRFPGRLTIRTHALATRVLFDDRNRAIGVEYLEGEHVYRAASRPSTTSSAVRRVRAGREVILAGGAFNTPQLLMLSGVGPRAELERHGIPVRIDLAGVGQNLQDRYEVAVVNRMNFPAWDALKQADLSTADPQYREWAAHRRGVYTTNGCMLSVILRSSVAAPAPDLLCYALLADFAGYYPGYSREIAANDNVLTWVVLKAHTNNTAGEVTLRSADPRDPPLINFKYFEEGSDGRGEDLDAVVEGVKFVRRMAAGLKEQSLIAREELPGDDVASDEQLRQFVRDNAWGHHASCTCRIGDQQDGGVLTTDFKVHGVEGLRIVDASVFPRIPGFFIASAIYMIGEKAADVIAKDAGQGGSSTRA